MQSRFDLRMLSEQMPGPRQRDRGGFVPGHQEGQYLVAQLLVVHRSVGLCVPGADEHAELIAMCARVAPALATDAVEDPVEPRDRASTLAIGACRHPHGRPKKV